MKSLLLALTGTLLLGACSKTVKEVHYENQVSKNNPALAWENQRNNDLELLRSLVNSKTPNLALAEVLARSMAINHQAEFKAMVEQIDPEVAEEIIKSVAKQNDSIRKQFLYHGQRYQNNQELLNNVVNKEFAINMPSVTDQLRISVFGYVKSKALNEIVDSYQKKAIEHTNHIALEIAYEIGTSNPTLAKKIENAQQAGNQEEIFELISKSGDVLKKIDYYFKTSQLKEKEQYAVLVTGLVAGGIYHQLNQYKNFQHLVKEAKKIIADVQSLQKKANEVIVLAGTLSQHIEETSKNLKDIKEGMDGTVKDLSAAFKEHKGKADFDSKNVVNFVYNRVILGKETNLDNRAVSVLSTSVNANVKKTAVAVAGMANNLGAILDTSRILMDKFGIKPSKDLQKFMETADKVVKVVKAVQGVVSGFAAGGPVGAAIGLVGSMSSFGGGGSADSAMLAAINKKLNIIIDNQKKMMELQLETMKMVKELAVLVDEYHKKEMFALSEIRDLNLIELEIGKANMNQGLASCETIIQSQIDFGKLFGFSSLKDIQDISNLKVNRKKFNSNIKSFKNLGYIANFEREDSFKDCQSGLSKAFDGRVMNENPLRSFYSSDENDNLMRFERNVYLPILLTMTDYAGTDQFDSVPLHYPVSNIATIQYKKDYLNDAKLWNNSNNVYDLDSLVSVKALERYVSSLLILHPLMELDKDTWSTSYEAIIYSYLDKTGFKSRGLVKLSNALKITQSAIAQEALLAGEPILHKMYPQARQYLSSSACDGLTGIGDNVCFIRGNKLLMKNFVMFALYTQLTITTNFAEVYEQAYSAKDLNIIAKLFNLELKTENFEVVKNAIVLKVNGWEKDSVKEVKIKLPDPSELRKGTVLYSENMPRLMQIQSLLIEELEKVAPMDRTHMGKDITDILVIANQGLQP